MKELETETVRSDEAISGNAANVCQRLDTGTAGSPPLLCGVVNLRITTWNCSWMTGEWMGCAFTLDKLANISGSNLCFRSLKPRLEPGCTWFGRSLRAVPGTAF